MNYHASDVSDTNNNGSGYKSNFVSVGTA